MARTSEGRTKVAQLRKALEMPLEEFAALISRGRGTLQSLESGRLKLSPGLAREISAQAGVDMNWLLDSAESGPPIDFGRNVLTRESFERHRALLLQGAEELTPEYMEWIATTQGEILTFVLKAIRDPQEFSVVRYLVARFIREIRRRIKFHEPFEEEFAPSKPKKSSGSKKEESKTGEGLAQSIATKPEALTFEEVARAIADLVAMGMLPPNASKIKREAIEKLRRRLEASGQLGSTGSSRASTPRPALEWRH